MYSKKIIAFLLSLGLIISFSSCKKNNTSVDAQAETTSVSQVTETTPAATTEAKSEIITEAAAEQTTEKITEKTTEQATIQAETTTKATEKTTVEVTTKNADDPSLWSKSKIVSVYKKAAGASDKVTSSQVMSLADFKINNGEGAVNGMFKLIRPVVTKILQKNSTEFEGITGGHQNILDSDIATAKAYSSGDNLVIEMTMLEQVDGAKADRYSGTVGHSISVVGDITEVMQMISDAGISATVADEDVTLTYSKPHLKVLIGKDGTILNGTWSYTVDLNLANFSVRSVTIDQASAVIDYVITVNGGFSE